MADSTLRALSNRDEPALADFFYTDGDGTSDWHSTREQLTSVTFTQATHGFSVGDWLYRSDATTWAAAQGNAAGHEAEALVVAVPDVNTLVLECSRRIRTLTAHGKGAAGADLWLSLSSAGADTTTKPAPDPGEKLQKLGVIMDANTILVDIQPYTTF